MPLNSVGIGQAHDAKSRLAHAPIATICCSPLSRARQTAEIINGALRCPLFTVGKLKEIYFAAAEGKPLLSHSYDVLLRNAESHGGESFGVFVSRVIAGINQALAYPGPVLIVVHGGVFCAIQTHVRVDRDGDMTNCVPVRLEPVDGEDCAWRVSPI